MSSAPRWTSNAPKLTRAPALDGVRGIGVLVVIFGHSLPKSTLSLAAFLDLFFVLSGFLITTMLLEEHRATRRIDLRSFYLRRTIRLLPSLWVLFAVTLVLGLVLHAADRLEPTFTLRGLWVEIAGGATYVHNLIFPFFNGSWMPHLWSLAIEEQFYLVAGLLVVGAIRSSRVRLSTACLALVLVAIWVWRASGQLGPAPWAASLVWLQRPDSLLTGVLAALISAQLPPSISERWSKLIGAAGLVAIGVFVFTSIASTALVERVAPSFHQPALPTEVRAGEALRGYWFNWGFSVAAISSAVIVFCGCRLPSWSAKGVLGWRPIAWIGRTLSYPLYLLHLPVAIVLHELFSKAGHRPLLVLPVWLLVVLSLVLPFGLAYPCARVVEVRALRLRSGIGFGGPNSVGAEMVSDSADLVGAKTTRRGRPNRIPSELTGQIEIVPTSARQVPVFLGVMLGGAVLGAVAGRAGAGASLVGVVGCVGLLAGLAIALGPFGSAIERERFRAGWSPSLLRPRVLLLMCIPVLCHLFGVDVAAIAGGPSVLVIAGSGGGTAILGYVAVQLFFALVEEAAWRGFLLPRVLVGRSPLGASGVVAAVWMSWFVPSLLRSDVDYGTMAFFGIGLFAVSVLQTAMWHRSGGSILAAVGFHFLANMTNLLDGGALRFATIVSFCLTAAIVAIRTHGTLYRQPGQTPSSVGFPAQLGPTGVPTSP